MSKICCLGDSLTEGSVADRPWPVIFEVKSGHVVGNYGDGGFQIAAISSNFSGDVAGEPYDSIILWAGINDVFQDRDASTVWTALETLIDLILADATGYTLFVCNLAPIGNHASYSAGKQAAIDGVNTSISGKAGITVLDVAATVADSGDSTLLNSDYDSGDGLHFSNAGELAVANYIRSVIGDA